MSITSYDQLLGELSQWLLHDVSDKAAVMVGLAEKQMRRDFRFLDGELPVSATGNGTDRFPLPPGYLGMRNIRITGVGDGYNLDQVEMSVLRRREASGHPTEFAIGRDIVFNHPHALTMEMLYLNKFEELSPTNQTNWVLVTADDAYLWGSLIYGGNWVRNDGIITKAEQYYGTIRDSLISEDKARRYSSGRRRSTPILPVEVPI